jgi:hypothetical protein
MSLEIPPSLLSKVKELNSQCDKLDSLILDSQIEKLKRKHSIGQLLSECKESVSYGSFGNFLNLIAKETKHSYSDYGHCMRFFSEYKEFKKFESALAQILNDTGEASWHFVVSDLLYDEEIPNSVRKVKDERTTLEKVAQRYGRVVLNLVKERIAWMIPNKLWKASPGEVTEYIQAICKNHGMTTSEAIEWGLGLVWKEWGIINEDQFEKIPVIKEMERKKLSATNGFTY